MANRRVSSRGYGDHPDRGTDLVGVVMPTYLLQKRTPRPRRTVEAHWCHWTKEVFARRTECRSGFRPRQPGELRIRYRVYERNREARGRQPVPLQIRLWARSGSASAAGRLGLTTDGHGPRSSHHAGRLRRKHKIVAGPRHGPLCSGRAADDVGWRSRGALRAGPLLRLREHWRDVGAPPSTTRGRARYRPREPRYEHRAGSSAGRLPYEPWSR